MPLIIANSKISKITRTNILLPAESSRHKNDKVQYGSYNIYYSEVMTNVNLKKKFKYQGQKVKYQQKDFITRIFM